ncbi:hypothetical protein JOD43_000841 [Pullulanibacillus pueri]|nr:hypothetical protein [Pullulanibacillus pueri]
MNVFKKAMVLYVFVFLVMFSGFCYYYMHQL